MGKSKDLATGETRFVNTAGDTMTGALTVGGTVTINPDADSSLEIKDAGTNALFMTAATGDELYIGANNEYAFRIKNDGTKDVAFDNGGRVTVPNQPCFAAYNYSAAGTTLATYYNPIRWGNVHANVGNCFNNTTGKFTFPVTGKYLCFCNINLKATDAQWFGLTLLYNNTSAQVNSWSQNLTNTAYVNVVISSIVSGNANDSMAFTWHNSYTAPSTNNSYNMAYIYLLG